MQKIDLKNKTVFVTGGIGFIRRSGFSKRSDPAPEQTPSHAGIG